eukprot:CAMPEP_0205911204 /NCGR_PEP_ID=MMETSP1325-20131115/4995_1 /ASSEMBLY_ACC=CAM_ASM_000708 /TAXON_ID=236786 /ORGANISM="Florenciella sp., Strain RCC1007" /LENGTH=109 /DNA_ID=CAMNT_0053277701 /DNA_START=90 /DNA_END=419 /DNA_ORIENTATION=+
MTWIQRRVALTRVVIDHTVQHEPSYTSSTPSMGGPLSHEVSSQQHGAPYDQSPLVSGPPSAESMSWQRPSQQEGGSGAAGLGGVGVGSLSLADEALRAAHSILTSDVPG